MKERKTGFLGASVPKKACAVFFFAFSGRLDYRFFFLCFSHGRCLLRTALPANVLTDSAMIAPTSKCILNPYTGVFA